MSFKKIWEWEIPSLDNLNKNYIRLITFTIVMAAFIVPFTMLLPTLNTDEFLLGIGLGMNPAGYQIYQDIYDYLMHEERYLMLIAIFALIITCMACWIYTTLQGFFYYEKNGVKKRFPLYEFGLFFSMNAIGVLLLMAALGAFGLLALSFGFNFEDGFNVIKNTGQYVNDQVADNVPTLIELPSFIAFLIVFQLSGIFHYGLHRAGHELRIMWLLFHRQHHMPYELHAFNTPFVVTAFPLFVVLLVPYHLLFASTTKLFISEPMYFEYIMYYISIKLMYYIADVYAHQTGLYERAVNNKFMWYLGWFVSSGVHHYIHHSSNPNEGKVSNITNIGGGLFYLYDYLFGTLKLATKNQPNIGLTNNPELHKNPLRLALAGLFQVGYELIHNKGFKDRLLIIFGRSNYTPPISKDFALKAKAIKC